MARGTKPCSKRGSKCSKNHSKTVHRWAIRKKREKADSLDRRIDDIVLAGNRRKLYFAHCHLGKVIHDKNKAEQEMLAKTSLKDLIK